jgi:hypothetical protein
MLRVQFSRESFTNSHVLTYIFSLCRHKLARHKDICLSTKWLMLHVRDCPGTTSSFDVCPFPWCRQVKHLLFHLVTCRDPAACSICTPRSISVNLAHLQKLNDHRFRTSPICSVANNVMSSDAASGPEKYCPLIKQSTSDKAPGELLMTSNADVVQSNTDQCKLTTLTVKNENSTTATEINTGTEMQDAETKRNHKSTYTDTSDRTGIQLPPHSVCATTGHPSSEYLSVTGDCKVKEEPNESQFNNSSKCLDGSSCSVSFHDSSGDMNASLTEPSNEIIDAHVHAIKVEEHNNLLEPISSSTCPGGSQGNVMVQ